ncbi:MAG: S9 family peptidase [Anaerolineales bacterium]|nr:S9 family peptidase [Anaerolineales bacterium]
MTDPKSPQRHQPSLRDLINLELPSGVKISPDGRQVAVLVRRTNWHENRYEILCWVYRIGDNGQTWSGFPVTHSGSVQQAEWIDNHSLALLKSGPGKDDKAQIWFYDHLSGDGRPVTDHKHGVEQFKPFAGGFVFLARDPKRIEQQERADQFGKFTHFEQEESTSALYYVNWQAWYDYQAQLRAATEKQAKKLVKPVLELSKLLPEPLLIENFLIAPDHTALYLNCRSRDDLIYSADTNQFRLALDAPAALAEYLQRQQAKQDKKPSQEAQPPEDQNDSAATQPEKEDLRYLGELQVLPLPKNARISAVSPDSQRLLINYQGRDQMMFTQADLWLLDVPVALQASGEDECRQALQRLTGSLDQQPLAVRWVPAGIFVLYADGQVFRLARFRPGGASQRLDFQGLYPYPVNPAYDVAESGELALVAANAGTLQEVYWAQPGSDPEIWPLQRLTNFGQALQGWDLGSLEQVRWRSKDGIEIQGVLRKPANYDPGRRYPLVMVVHGGPSWVSPAFLLTSADLAYYPSVQFSHQDMLVLYPNYRGSLGRGQAFLELNVDHLGVGDLWDLESAIDHLDAQGLIDSERVGCMGWSQGGYISAFAATHSRRFRAVSVGAGISDWYTYHISNDIPRFTIDYLSGSPFRDRSRYDQTAPIRALSEKSAPALIQHGSDDRRVPLSNAMELYRGLQEMGVPTELFIFPGFGHPITKPRENHAVMHQNLAWFKRYLLGEDTELF